MKTAVASKYTIHKLAMLAVVCCLVGHVIAISILCAVPPVSRDALTHHLAIPKLYLTHGVMSEFPSIMFSYFPMNIDLLYMIPLHYGIDIAAKYIHFLFALLTALLIYRFIKKWLNSLFGLLGTVIFLTLPVITKLSITAYVDLGLIFFSTGGLIALINWVSNGFKLRHVAIAGVYCGLALGTKYNALVVFCLMALSLPLIGLRYCHMKYGLNYITHATWSANRTLIIKATLLFSCIAVLFYSPWAIRNYVWTGNPIYPLYGKFFENIFPTEEKVFLSEKYKERELYAPKTDLNHFTVRRLVYKETPWEIATVPIRVFFQGQDDNPKLFDGKLHPILLFLPLIAFLGCRKDAPEIRTGKKYLMLFAWLFIIFAYFSTDMRVRYIAPAIPPLVILSVFGFHNLIEFVKTRTNKRYIAPIFAGILFCAIIIPNIGYLNGLFRYYMPMDYLRKNINRDAYIENYRPEHAAMKFANTHLPSDAKILGIYIGNRRYYSERDIYFNNELVANMLLENQSPEEIVQTLREMKFSHLLVNHPAYKGYIISRLDQNQKIWSNRLFKDNLSLLYYKAGFALYAL